MSRKSKVRIVRRAVHRYLESQELHKKVEDMEEDIKSVDGFITQLESKCDSIENYYGVGYKIINAQIHGLHLLEEHLNNRLAVKKKQCIPLSLLREIISDDVIKTEGMVISIIKTYLNTKEGGDSIPACKDSLSMELWHKGMSHRKSDEQASMIVHSIFSKLGFIDKDKDGKETDPVIINTRKVNEPKYQREAYGGYLRNQSRTKTKVQGIRQLNFFIPKGGTNQYLYWYRNKFFIQLKF